MDVNYEDDKFMSNQSLETEYYDSTTVDYSEYNSSEVVTEISNGTYYFAEDLPDWRDNFWALFGAPYLRNNLGWTITVIVAYTLIFLIGLIGNCMVILVVIKRPQMRTVTNLFIMNLAVSDLLVILFCVPNELLRSIFIPWILGPVGCKGAYYFKWVSLCASAYSLAAISLDRCKAIYLPQVPPRGLSKRQVVLTIGLIWTVSLTLPIPSTMVRKFNNRSDRFPVCVSKWENQSHRKIYFLAVKLFFFYCSPLILIVISNLIIWWNVSKRKVPEQCARASRIGKMHRETRQSVGKMLGIVTLAFLLSWLPHYVFYVNNLFLESYIDRKLKLIFYPLLPLLYSSNSSINPVLYAFLSKKFREAFKSLLPNWLLSNERTENNCEKSCSTRETTANAIKH